MNPTAWANIHESCTDFIERFGAEAVRMGWTAIELFSVYPDHGLLRVDWCGAMMAGGKAVGIEANRILFGNLSAYRSVPSTPIGIPIWKFTARAKS